MVAGEWIASTELNFMSMGVVFNTINSVSDILESRHTRLVVIKYGLI